MAKKLLILLALVALPVAARAVPCSQVFTFQTGQVLTAANLNANPSNEINCINNIDNTNIGTAGLYASQIVPTNTSQATFGGSQSYIFPAGISAPSFIATNGGVNLTNTTTSSGQAASSVYLSRDGGSTMGMNLNVPTSSTNGWRFLTNGATLQADISANGQLTLSGPALATENGFSTATYMPPMYTASGAAVASTLHGALFTCTLPGTSTASCTITLTGAAVFTSATSYACSATFTAPINISLAALALFTDTSSGSQFVVSTGTSGTGSSQTISGLCIGT